MIDKLALGTVQFGLNYGINNPAGQISQDEIYALLEMAGHVGIDYLDTAFSYGESESVLGGFFREKKQNSHFKIITKMAPTQSPEIALEHSLERLGCSRVYGYMLHDFTATRSGDLNPYQAMRAAVEEGLAEKGGFSLYYPSELQYALDAKLDFEIVQVPYSLLDRRFEPYFLRLNEMGVEIHVRSVYLQGLVFLDDEQLVGTLSKARNSIGRLREISRAYKLGIAELCLRFSLSHPKIDRVVIGVNGTEHLKENIKHGAARALNQNLLSDLNELSIDDETVLLPFLWNR